MYIMSTVVAPASCTARPDVTFLKCLRVFSLRFKIKDALGIYREGNTYHFPQVFLNFTARSFSFSFSIFFEILFVPRDIFEVTISDPECLIKILQKSILFNHLFRANEIYVC